MIPSSPSPVSNPASSPLKEERKRKLENPKDLAASKAARTILDHQVVDTDSPQLSKKEILDLINEMESLEGHLAKAKWALINHFDKIDQQEYHLAHPEDPERKPTDPQILFKKVFFCSAGINAEELKKRFEAEGYFFNAKNGTVVPLK